MILIRHLNVPTDMASVSTSPQPRSCLQCVASTVTWSWTLCWPTWTQTSLLWSLPGKTSSTLSLNVSVVELWSISSCVWNTFRIWHFYCSVSRVLIPSTVPSQTSAYIIMLFYYVIFLHRNWWHIQKGNSVEICVMCLPWFHFTSETWQGWPHLWWWPEIEIRFKYR